MFFKVGDIVTVIDLDTYEKIDGSNIGFYNIDSRIMRAMPIAMINEYRGHKVEIKGTEVVSVIREYLTANYENNTLGARIINTLINQYFIKGGTLGSDDVEEIMFQTKLELD